MEKGEKYLRIKISDKAVPNEKGYYKAFLNGNKDADKDPDYKSKGVAVWVAIADGIPRNTGDEVAKKFQATRL